MDDRIGPIGGLLAILLLIAGVAFIFGGPQAAGRVLASPFRLFGWAFRRILRLGRRMIRAILRAIRRRIAALVRRGHRYFYRRWPVWTIAVEGLLIAIPVVTLLILIWLHTG